VNTDQIVNRKPTAASKLAAAVTSKLEAKNVKAAVRIICSGGAENAVEKEGVEKRAPLGSPDGPDGLAPRHTAVF